MANGKEEKGHRKRKYGFLVGTESCQIQKHKQNWSKIFLYAVNMMYKAFLFCTAG